MSDVGGCLGFVKYVSRAGRVLFYCWKCGIDFESSSLDVVCPVCGVSDCVMVHHGI